MKHIFLICLLLLATASHASRMPDVSVLRDDEGRALPVVLWHGELAARIQLLLPPATCASQPTTAPIRPPLSLQAWETAVAAWAALAVWPS